MSINHDKVADSRLQFVAKTVLTLLVAALVVDFAYRRVFIDIFPTIIRNGQSGYVMLSSIDSAGPLLQLSSNLDRASIDSSIDPHGNSSIGFSSSTGRLVASLSVNGNGTPELRFRDPHTGFTAFQITVLPDGSAEIYAPKGLTIVETPRDRDAERLSPADDDQPKGG